MSFKKARAEHLASIAASMGKKTRIDLDAHVKRVNDEERAIIMGKSTKQRQRKRGMQWCEHDDCIEPRKPGQAFCSQHTKALREDALRDKGVFAAGPDSVIVCDACDAPRAAGTECATCAQATAELHEHIDADLSIFELD